MTDINQLVFMELVDPEGKAKLKALAAHYRSNKDLISPNTFKGAVKTVASQHQQTPKKPGMSLMHKALIGGAAAGLAIKGVKTLYDRKKSQMSEVEKQAQEHVQQKAREEAERKATEAAQSASDHSNFGHDAIEALSQHRNIATGIGLAAGGLAAYKMMKSRKKK